MFHSTAKIRFFTDVRLGEANALDKSGRRQAQALRGSPCLSTHCPADARGTATSKLCMLSTCDDDSSDSCT